MEISTQIHFPETSQIAIWAAMGGVEKLNDWLSNEGFYLVPEQIEKVKSGNDEHGEWWQLSHNKEGIQLTFEVVLTENLRLWMNLIEERGNQLPLKSLTHDIQLLLDTESKDNSTYVLWITEFEFKTVHSNRLKNWYLKGILEEELRVHIEQLQEWSLAKLHSMVVRHDIIADENSSDWWEREFFDDFKPEPEISAG